MIEQRASAKAFLDHQHRFRGLIAAFKSQKFVPDPTRAPARLFRSGVRGLLLDARAGLHQTQYLDFLTWTRFQTKKQVPELMKIPVGYDELTGVHVKAPEVNLEKELMWIATLINVDTHIINDFRLNVDQVEILLEKSSFNEAIGELARIEEKYGVALWLVQLRICLEQLSGGLEKQKRYTSKVRSIYKNGLLGFITYNTSVRNEDRTTLAKFFDDIRVKISKHKYYDEPIKKYVRYRLTSELPDDEEGLADVLRVEQSHSIIDIYETFVLVLQRIVNCEDMLAMQMVISRVLRLLDDIHDPRLKKIAIAIGEYGAMAKLPLRNNLLLENVRSGSKADIRSSYKEIQRNSQSDPWDIIYIAAGISSNSDKQLISATPRNISRLLARVLCRADDNDAFQKLVKLVENLKGIPKFEAIRELLTQLRQSRPDKIWRPWLIGLNSRTVGLEDITPFCLDESAKELVVSELVKNSGKTFWMGFLCPDQVCSPDENELELIFRAGGFVRENRWQEAIDLIKKAENAVLDEALRAIAASLSLHAAYMLGKRQTVIEIVADEGARGSISLALTPVESSLSNYVWDDYKLVSSPLTPLIALHLLWVTTESEFTLSLLRFATGNFLRTSGIKVPSKLYDSASLYPSYQLIYFLRFVCVPQIIDASRVLKGTKHVMDERQAICAALRLLDERNSDLYQSEILEISNQLALDEGRWIVDRTRIHVDVPSLARWASREISEDFARYKDLRDVSVDALQDFDDVIKELNDVKAAAKTVFIPEDEADAVLVSMLGRLREEFLNNPTFGLDFYLSQRIRHQSFVGLIRGPLEFAQLITTREGEAKAYRRNQFWLDKFEGLDIEALNAINTAFVKCATNFDELLLSAKNEHFQVSAEDRPRGLLFLDLSIPLINVARIVARMDLSVDDFIRTTVSVLWGALEPSLASIRKFITILLKTAIVAIFDELRASIRKIAAPDSSAFLELDMQIGQCSLEVQRALDDAATWFSRADVEAQKRLFKLDQIVKIAIDSALKSQRGFHPNLELDIKSEDFQMHASALVFVHDVLFIALDNVRAHSNMKSPKIRIEVVPDMETGVLVICVRSEAKDTARITNEGKLHEISALIKNGNVGRRSSREGGSGILKLAAVTKQSAKGDLKYGFIENGWFELQVRYSMILQSPLSKGEINVL
ncbi:hypothetical protein [Pseudoduganella sp. UC29_71]|uniref:hypothetical protein n=1 Tax=Pseudoduganella sp. UC29_71 TaxID=3350174 RepID=UPI0036709FC2